MTGEEIFTAATRQGLVVSTGILGDLMLPAGTFDPGHADEIGPEGPTVRNRTVEYFLHYLGAGSRAAVERSKVRFRISTVTGSDF
jgi:hypothetical protein